MPLSDPAALRSTCLALSLTLQNIGLPNLEVIVNTVRTLNPTLLSYHSIDHPLITYAFYVNIFEDFLVCLYPNSYLHMQSFP
jgi:hypothetical protein